MDYAALRNEILNGPHAAECAPFVINYDAPKTVGAFVNDQTIASVLNTAPGGVGYDEVTVDAKKLLEELPLAQAAAFLEKLETAAASNTTLKWVMKYMTNGGINLGKSQMRAMLGNLVTNNVITAAERDAVLALAERPIGYAESVLGAPVTGADVSIALRGGAAYDPRA